MSDIQPCNYALSVAHEACEWERIMWGVLWDTQPDDAPRARHLCCSVNQDGMYSEIPALFATKREARQHINRYFDWVKWNKNRRPPANNRLPRPYRVRVRITVP